MHSVPLSEAKAKLARLVQDAETLGETVVITRSGRPAGVLVGIEEYEGLLETLEILADPLLREAVRAGMADAERGATVAHEELWNGLDHQVQRKRR